jgi:hypothetical protein
VAGISGDMRRTVVWDSTRGLPPEKSVNPTLIEPVDLDVLGSWRFYGVVDYIRKAVLADRVILRRYQITKH